MSLKSLQQKINKRFLNRSKSKVIIKLTKNFSKPDKEYFAYVGEKTTSYLRSLKTGATKTHFPKGNLKTPKIAFVCVLLILGVLSPAFAENIKASWYSVESLKKEGTWKHSHGVMANGKIFNDSQMTCASRLYSLGSMIRVKNLKNGHSVIVKVTDRIGKRFANTRIDLSKGAFNKIAPLNEGLIPIKVELVD